MDMTAFRRAISVSMATVLAGSMFVGCGGGGVEGTYTDPGGGFMLELKSGGKASMTMMGNTQQCTYTVKDKQIPVVCGGDTMEFTVHDDGSLTGPPGGFVP